MNDLNTRRELLKRTGMLAMGAMTLPWAPRVALAPLDAPTQGDILVCVFMRGAADGLNLVVPHGDKDYYAARSTIAIPQPGSGKTDAAIDLNGFFGLHPSLKPLKDIYNVGALAIIDAVGSPDPSHSHFDAMDFMERGTPGDKSISTGWIGRQLSAMASNNQSPYRAVGMGTLLQQSLQGPVQALALQSIADFHLQGDQKKIQPFADALSSLYDTDGFIAAQGKQTIRALNDFTQLSASIYVPANGAKYPDTTFGKSLANVAQLIKSGMGVEVAAVDLGGWDTHVQEANPFARLADEFAQGLAAFYADMQDQMDHITLVTMSEFGRRVQENTSHGTDHGHGNVMFVMGGGINGGKVYADWPTLSKNALYGPGDLAITTDFRDVLGEIVANRLKNSDLASIFPGYTSFKFRGITKGANGAAPPLPKPSATPQAIVIELPFGIKIPLDFLGK